MNASKNQKHPGVYTKKADLDDGATMIDLSVISIFIQILLSAYTVMWVLLAIIHLLPKKDHSVSTGQLPPVSVIIPARNEEKVIRNIITDLSNQTYKNLEIIVVAHNCTDNTLNYAIEASNKSNVPVRICKLETSESGKGLALEFGLEQANGDLIAYFDADNRVPPSTIENCVGWIEDGYDGVQARILTSNPHQNSLTYLQHAELTIYHTIYCAGNQRLNLNSGIGGTGVVLRKTSLLAAGGFRNVLIEDYDVLLRLTLAHFKVGYADNAIVYDEKPPSWRGFIKQRTRWTAGHLQLWGRYSLREKLRLLRSPTEFLHFLTPISSIALLASAILGAASYLFPQVTYWSSPLPYWLGSMLIANTLYSLVLHKEGGFSHKGELLLPYALFLYSTHWLLALFNSFLINGWNDTKTEHSYAIAEPPIAIAFASTPIPQPD